MTKCKKNEKMIILKAKGLITECYINKVESWNVHF